MDNICSVNGCFNKHYALGYCNKHWQRFHRSGDPLIVNGERHGMTTTLEYTIWANMKDRCYNEDHHAYHRYGGRGITVCDRWKNSFTAFYEDMGYKPFPKAQIDRIDNDGNYEPVNCVWVSGKENSRHTSTTKITPIIAEDIIHRYNSGKVLQKDLAEEYSVCISTISQIVNLKTWVP